jgi:hypothetical protein
VDGAYAVSDLTGSLHLTPDRLVITELKAHRGRADLAGQGTISWPNNRPHIALSGSATNLLLDAPLYHLLPTVAQQAWDQVQPEGAVDLNVSYTGEAGAPATQPTSGDGTAGASLATTSRAPAQLELTIRPRQLAATLKAVPYRLEEITGAITVADSRVQLQDLSARHGDARVRLSGSGAFSGSSSTSSSIWDLKLGCDDVPIDEAFRTALPEALSELVDALKLRGTLSFEFPRLVVALPGEQAASMVSTRAATSQEHDAPAANVDFALELKTPRASLDLGVPLTNVIASVTVAGTVRQGHLNELSGTLRAPSLVMAGRPLTDFKTGFEKAPDSETLRIGAMRGKIAGGELAGDVDLKMPRVGPSRYALNLVLRDADVKTIAADEAGDRPVNGRLTASLAMEGEWSNTSTRRGRGDVSVSGKEMYKIPLVLGLLQITNLALPITSPFNEATVAYSVDGNRVSAERIVLRSKDMLMQGSGYLDFTTRRVRMTFTTDNPNWPKLPIVGEFMRGAKNELLKIRVRGTLQEPKVGATPMTTFSTTVDEVLRGGDEDEN